MLSERLQKRLMKDRPMTTITMRIPVDMLESLREIAPRKGFSKYQTLLKSYISDGLRRDEAQYTLGSTTQTTDVPREQGVPDKVLEEAAGEAVVP